MGYCAGEGLTLGVCEGVGVGDFVVGHFDGFVLFEMIYIMLCLFAL